MRGKLVVLTFVSMLMTFTIPVPALADGSDTPPPPIIVTATVNTEAGPNSVVPGPGGASVTITNRYYPYYGGAVKTDGWAQATNFNEPPNHRFSCQSHVYNSAGQHGTYEWSHGSNGGNNCPVTPLAVLSGVVPATYTSWTKSWWRWPDLSPGYGIAPQSHYEP